jgi:DNA mismatch repair protein MutS2
MAQSGMHIPAAAPSRVPIFSQIFADIGDEQSIEQSLSTFSSHMSNIIRILRALENPGADAAPQSDGSDWYTVLNTDPGASLVLLDELGAGTDPVEGAALARSIIERLLELGCLGVATTHYAELKAFAYSTERVQNASVEFNIETLAPTYRLTIGLPGRSNALAIAQRLGLPAPLVERARSTVTREDAQVEDLLAGIHREREEALAERAAAERVREDAEKYRSRLARELEEFEQARQTREEEARQQLDDELREVRNQLRRLRDDFSNVSLSRQWMQEAEQRLEQTKTQVQETAAKTKGRPATPTPAPAPAAPQPQAPRPLQVGDTVFVRSVGLSGEIVSIDEEDQTADVQVGGFRMKAELRELRREKRSPEEERRARYAATPAITTPAVSDVSMTFDMRGWRASEVTDKLDRYLNDAYLAGLPMVRLIHGKGTGALRQVVRDVLQGHPLVASFGGGGQDGGDGVTVAKLTDR